LCTPKISFDDELDENPAGRNRAHPKDRATLDAQLARLHHVVADLVSLGVVHLVEAGETPSGHCIKKVGELIHFYARCTTVT
jgi:hypothetical protein